MEWREGDGKEEKEKGMNEYEILSGLPRHYKGQERNETVDFREDEISCTLSYTATTAS